MALSEIVYYIGNVIIITPDIDVNQLPSLKLRNAVL